MRSFAPLLLCIVFSVLQCALGEDVANAADGPIELTADSFDQIVDGSREAFVKFFAPWCGHCQAMAKDFQDLYKYVNEHTKGKVVVAKVNGQNERSLMKRYNIDGFPTILWFSKGGDVNKPEKYHGGRDMNSMLEWIKKHSKLPINIPSNRQHSKELTLSSLESTIKGKNVFVKFYAPWCGHCKSFKPQFEKIAAAFKNEPGCVIASLDGSAEREASERYGIKGFPTFKYFTKGKDEPEDYTGARDTESILAFINEKCGTLRRIDGSLLPEAGIIMDFEKLAKEVLLSKSPKKEQYLPLIDQLRQLNPGFAGDFYAKLLTKVLLDASHAFIKTELERIESVMKTGQFDETIADHFAIRKNIMSRLVSILEAAHDIELKSEQ